MKENYNRGSKLNPQDRTQSAKYDEHIYSQLSLENLIVFGIYSVIKNGETCTFERLVAECFSAFPKIFTFKRYSYWPDSLKFDRPLRKLREKGLIVGSVKDRFLLTEFGEKIAKDIKNILSNKIIPGQKRKTPAGRSVDDKLITYLKGSNQFRRFLKEPQNFLISDSEFRNLLRCTLETPLRVLKQNLEYFKNLAKSYNEEKLLNFLLSCEKKFLKKGGGDG